MVNNSGVNKGVIANNVDAVYINADIKKRIPSLLPKFIEVLAKQYTSDSPKQDIDNNQPYEIEEKIEYNKIFLHKELIEEYYIYYYICERSFESLRHIDENSKKNILTDINDIYRDIRIEIFKQCTSEEPIEEFKKKIKTSSDEIIKSVKTEIRNRIITSYDGEQFNEQELNLCLNIFVCYALAECKILERPKKSVDN
ncbi:ABC-three component system protein [Peribacillus simplex]|uniref:ABC-three component systems C-terminal domain-containing protein n=1 Tax=Peribacillus simplex NBRC 15720 = DSM 1321 TaxID=1349754 RepID=A0A223EN05_9BACI|nr:ABC-three component system protein [Peribacillus simplex]ASS96633.1 hypothetical protein BS1321_23640 [Peribacillus simplex NBRC 15720 = DSM 1321]MEC1395966.1 hypothetical protein [Peribacillus simplex]